MAWKSVPGYSKYEINEKGEIRTKETGYVTKGGDAGRYLKTNVTDDNDKTTLEYMHYLVCITYHGKRKEGMVVSHADNDRTNNAPANLSWTSQSDNVQKAYDDGLKPSKESLFEGFNNF